MKKTDHRSDQLWLVNRADPKSRHWLVQPYGRSGSDWIPAGEAWQVADGQAGHQRLQAKWQQGGKPLVAVNIDIFNTAGNTPSVQQAITQPATGLHWTVCASGSRWEGHSMPMGPGQLPEWKWIRSCGVHAFAVCELPSEPSREASITAGESSTALPASFARLFVVRRLPSSPGPEQGLLSWLPSLQVWAIAAAISLVPLALQPITEKTTEARHSIPTHHISRIASEACSTAGLQPEKTRPKNGSHHDPHR